MRGVPHVGRPYEADRVEAARRRAALPRLELACAPRRARSVVPGPAPPVPAVDQPELMATRPPASVVDAPALTSDAHPLRARPLDGMGGGSMM